MAFYRLDAKRLGEGERSKAEIVLLGTAKFEKRASVVLVPKKPARSSLAWLRNDDAIVGYVSNPDLLNGERSASQS